MKENSNHKSFFPGSMNYPFHTPQNYFDEFPTRMMEIIEKEEYKNPKKILFKNYKVALGIAASFLIIVGIIFISSNYLSSRRIVSDLYTVPMIDEEFLISYQLFEGTFYESLENSILDDPINYDQLESVLLATVSEYELIDLNN